jgi:hypothetical protein
MILETWLESSTLKRNRPIAKSVWRTIMFDV